jgi:hypothetical protein
MLQDKEFSNLVFNRYYELRRTILSKSQLDNTIDSVAALLDEAQNRHYRKWNILGINVGTPEPDFQPITYGAEIVKFKEWINTRLTWLDDNMNGFEVSVEDLPANQYICRIFPNPVSDILYAESDTEIKGYSIFNITGIVVKEQVNLCDFSVQVVMTGLKPGIYIVRIEFSNGEIFTARVVKK